VRVQLVKIDLQSEGVKVLSVNGPSGTYLELVRFLQEASDGLGELFDIGLPVVTDVLAGSERELKGISRCQSRDQSKRQALSTGGTAGS